MAALNGLLNTEHPPVVPSVLDRVRGIPYLSTPILAFVAFSLVMSVAGTSWYAYTMQRDVRENDRQQAMTIINDTVASYGLLAQVNASGGEIEPELLNFSNQVKALHAGESGAVVASFPALDELASRLQADLYRIKNAIKVAGEGTMLAPQVMAAEAFELAGMARRIGMQTDLASKRDQQTERDQRTMDRLRWLLMSTLIGLTLAGLVLVFHLVRRNRQWNAFRITQDAAMTELREALAAAENAAALKNQFIATVSHEVRTPMNAVLGLADALLEDRLSHAQREQVDMIRESGGNVLRMLNDILDFSKLDAGRMTLDAQPFSPEVVTSTTVVTIAPRAREKGLTIVAIPSPGLPKRLMGDSGRVGQILLNLASNAVKFTESGGVSLQVLCPERDERKATIEWVITDTGVGIDSAQIGGLFNDYAQADETIANRFGGTGLGLAICKRLVDQMGGEIAVESKPGEGSRFRVRLTFPIAVHTAEAQKAEARPQSVMIEAAFKELVRAMGREPRVLVAEDNPTNQFVIQRIMALEGIKPEIVENGRAAVEAAAARHYDIICMDMRMPEMDGLEATKRIRAGHGASAASPIIALTASAFPEDVQACLDAGMNLFVPKPVRKEALLSAMVSVLSSERPDLPEMAAAEAWQTAE